MLQTLYLNTLFHANFLHAHFWSVLMVTSYYIHLNALMSVLVVIWTSWHWIYHTAWPFASRVYKQSMPEENNPNPDVLHLPAAWLSRSTLNGWKTLFVSWKDRSWSKEGEFTKVGNLLQINPEARAGSVPKEVFQLL
jgi:hypothetical protein